MGRMLGMRPIQLHTLAKYWIVICISHRAQEAVGAVVHTHHQGYDSLAHEGMKVILVCPREHPRSNTVTRQPQQHPEYAVIYVGYASRCNFFSKVDLQAASVYLNHRSPYVTNCNKKILSKMEVGFWTPGS